MTLRFAVFCLFVCVCFVSAEEEQNPEVIRRADLRSFLEKVSPEVLNRIRADAAQKLENVEMRVQRLIDGNIASSTAASSRHLLMTTSNILGMPAPKTSVLVVDTHKFVPCVS